MADPSATDALEDLTSNIDTLTTSLEPLLSKPLHHISSSYEPIEKAKLFTFTAYAIESILLAYQRINVGSHPDEARSHPILEELKRVQTYMKRIHDVANPAGEPEQRVDKAAAGRFITAGLAGNVKYDEERARRQEEGRLEAKRKFEAMNDADKARRKKSKIVREGATGASVADKQLELVKAEAPSAETTTTDKPKKDKSKKKKKSKSGGEET